MFLDGDEKSSCVGRGVLHGDSSLLVRVMSESSITESNKVAETFGKPVLGHSQGHEDLSNTERVLVSMLTNCMVPSITLFTEDVRHCSFVIATSFIAMPTWKFRWPWFRISFNNTSEMDRKTHK